MWDISRIRLEKSADRRGRAHDWCRQSTMLAKMASYVMQLQNNYENVKLCNVTVLSCVCGVWCHVSCVVSCVMCGVASNFVALYTQSLSEK